MTCYFEFVKNLAGSLQKGWSLSQKGTRPDKTRGTYEDVCCECLTHDDGR